MCVVRVCVCSEGVCVVKKVALTEELQLDCLCPVADVCERERMIERERERES